MGRNKERKFVPPKPKTELRSEDILKSNKKYKKSGISRRQFLTGTTAIALGLAGMGAGVKIIFEPEQAEVLKTDLILKRARELGFTPDIVEQKLWWDDGFTKKYEDVNSDEAKAEFDRRVLTTLDKMRVSKNPYFKDAYDYLKSVADKKRMYVRRMDEAQARDKISAGISFDYDSVGSFRYYLNINPDFVMNETNPLTLAGIITHEAWHIQRYEEELSRHPSGLSTQEQINALEEFEAVPGQIKVEEAFAYGKEAEAYIRQAGLIGAIYGVISSGEENRALKYLELGSDSSSPEWIDYIVSIGGVNESQGIRQIN